MDIRIRKEFVGRRQQNRRVLAAVKKTFTVNESTTISYNNKVADTSDEMQIASPNNSYSNVNS